MKGHKRLLFFIVMVFLISITGVYAGDRAECPYGSQIDKMISFYQGRLYLFDSPYKILAEIARDAEKGVVSTGETEELIHEMERKGIASDPKKITGYIASYPDFSANVAEAYEEP